MKVVQNLSANTWECLHLRFVRSSDSGNTTWGKEPSGHPISRQFDVIASGSATSAETYPRGFEFRMA